MRLLLNVATASCLNAFLMRKHELKEGIEVFDGDGKVVGTSQVAAKHVSTAFVYDPVAYMCIDPLPETTKYWAWAGHAKTPYPIVCVVGVMWFCAN